MSNEESQTEEQQTNEQPIDRLPYTQENLINDHNLRNTDYKAELIAMVDNALLYQSTKRYLRGIIYNYFSDNRFLTNLDDGKYRNGVIGTSLDLEKDLIFATSAFMPSDLMNPDLTSILNAINTHNRPTVNRAKGGQRERMLNGKYRVSQESTAHQTLMSAPVPVQPQEKKKSWLSFIS